MSKYSVGDVVELVSGIEGCMISSRTMCTRSLGTVPHGAVLAMIT
jgi:hypothetical protein